MLSPSGARIPFIVVALVFLLVPTGRVEADPIAVAEFGFEDAAGQPDPQGWRELEEYQDEEAYFHVDDLSGQGHVIAPLAGEASMWCGVAAEDARACHWGFAPGYGAAWRQNLRSVEFAVEGDVTLAFLMAASLEPGYDHVFVQFENLAGEWQNLDDYSCGPPLDCGPSNRSYVVAASDHDGTVRFRFFLTSDGAGDAETFPIGFSDPYGFVVDDLTVSDATGTISSQDFEGEALGAQATLDGDWFAEPNVDSYHGGVLVSGTDVLQESSTLNDTPMWAFFGGSTRDYGCAGHPEQPVVDETNSIIRSPRIDITTDIHGNGIEGEPDSLVVEFDVYRDIAPPPGADKYYDWYVSTYSEGCLLQRRSVSGGGYGEQKDWYRQSVRFVPEAGTKSIVVELGVSNRDFGPTDCRSHSPLFDAVTISRVGGTVTAVGDGPRLRAVHLRQNVPNPFNPRTSIEFEVPSGSARVSLRVYDVDGRLVRTLLDAPAVAGPGSVQWDGRDRQGRSVASGVYYYELVIDEHREARRMVLIE